LPIVSYYEIGTNLTANHAHAAMMGVYGMLAAWMVFVTLLPSGILQLYHSVDVGYYDARTLTYIGNRTNTLLEWLRLPGDVLFIAGGVAPLLWVAIQGVLHHGRHEGLPEDDELHLFTEIEHLEPAEASAAGTLTDGS
ncbi:MAG TPA: hypothetical protein VI248_02225, partial [Kineosporiaceae bacterium]